MSRIILATAGMLVMPAASASAQGAPGTGPGAENSAPGTGPGAESAAAATGPGATVDSWALDGAFEEVARGAADAEMEEQTSGRFLPTGFSARGALRYENFTYFERLPTKNNGRNSGELFLEGRYQKGAVTAHAAGRARKDLSDQSRDTVQAGEIYVELHKSPVTIRAGRFLATWGRGTLSSPVDLLNPADLRDPLAREKLPTYMVRGGLTLGQATIEGYYLPVPEGHRIPTYNGIDEGGQPFSDSRWLEDGTMSSQRFDLTLGGPPRPSARTFQGAARIVMSGHGFDVAVGYARLYDRTPIIRMARAPMGLTPTRISYDYRPNDYITLEAERAIGKVRLVGEGLITLTENFNDLTPDPEIEESSFAGMVGADYRSDEFFSNHYLRFFLEYNFAKGIDNSLARDALAYARRPFLYQVLARAQYDAGENLHLYIQGTAAPTRYDMLVQPGASYTYRDLLTVSVQATLLRGSGESSFYGRFQENSRLSSTIELKF